MNTGHKCEKCGTPELGYHWTQHCHCGAPGTCSYYMGGDVYLCDSHGGPNGASRFAPDDDKGVHLEPARLQRAFELGEAEYKRRIQAIVDVHSTVPVGGPYPETVTWAQAFELERKAAA